MINKNYSPFYRTYIQDGYVIAGNDLKFETSTYVHTVRNKWFGAMLEQTA